MRTNILKGAGSGFIEEPEATWEVRLAQAPEEFRKVLAFMSPDHHLVRYYVVLELPRAGRPLTPGAIAEALGLPEPRVRIVLEELERNLFFLVRNDDGAVTWAFPVTVAETPHHLSFSTGERLDAA
ncbi:MAG: hypothetical protein LJF30_21020 [Acidobacteria bacterium]|jgi:hypothetical protein|nr:hypothetical protein [Acidobacteriota bacterium]